MRAISRLEDQAGMGQGFQDPRHRPLRPMHPSCGAAGRVPATRGGDPGQGGRALGASTPRTDWFPHDLSDRRLRQAIHGGELPTIHVGKRLLVAHADLEAFLQGRRTVLPAVPSCARR